MSEELKEKEDPKKDDSPKVEEPKGEEPAKEDSKGGEKPAEKPAAAEKKPPEVDWKDRYTRLLADFDNYKKRMVRERDETYGYAESDVLKSVLPTVDNLALALANAADKAEDPFVKGVQLVYDTLLKSLKDRQAEPFDSIGKPLDTERMEAVATLPDDKVAEGLVSNEVKRGWTLKGKVLRVAQVVISSGKAEEKK